MEYFDINEFKCPCCGRVEMDQSFLNKLDKSRDSAQVAFKVNSGYRCTKHNKDVGGSKTSSHLYGVAADISAPDSLSRFKIVESMISSGIKRIGIGKKFIHADDDELKIHGVIWLY